MVDRIPAVVRNQNELMQQTFSGSTISGLCESTNATGSSQCERQEAKVVAMRKHGAADEQRAACSDDKLQRRDGFQMFHATSLMLK
ncbi:hypothetical protein CIW53_11285 [Rhodanobacter sp. T12-5]|nr:hypothetical protein CIW53_11285 [Rhodanobacter sp. T12-5]